MNWTSAGIATPPNLATELVARAAPGVVEWERFAPLSLTSPHPGIWVFDFGQNFAGWPELHLPPMAAGVTVTLKPAEGLRPDGTVDQASLGFDERGTDLFNTYTTAGLPGGEVHRPLFSYFGMQWVQVEGLPADIVPGTEMLTGIRLQAATALVGSFDSSSARMNRLYRMIHYSMASQIMSTFTDCPGREKQSYPADYTMPMAGFHRIFDFDAYLRTTQRHLVEGQSRADTPMFGNVALKTPVHDWGYTRNFGDEINWGNGIVLVPWFLLRVLRAHRDDAPVSTTGWWISSTTFGARRPAAVSTRTSSTVPWPTGWQRRRPPAASPAPGDTSRRSRRWPRSRGSRIILKTPRNTRALPTRSATAFNRAFLNTTLGYYTAQGDRGADGASQAAQALALDAGLVPEEFRATVIAGWSTPFVSSVRTTVRTSAAGTIGLAAVVRQLSATGNGQILFDAVHTDTEPGYGYFMESTVANPGGFTTIGEEWNRGASRNHMILTQIVEWFQTGLVGIQQAPGSVGYQRLRIIPRPVGDLVWAEGSFRTPRGAASVRWDLADGQFTLAIQVPPNTSAEVWIVNGRPSDR